VETFSIKEALSLSGRLLNADKHLRPWTHLELLPHPDRIHLFTADKPLAALLLSFKYAKA
jgi:hypothetical protein